MLKILKVSFFLVVGSYTILLLFSYLLSGRLDASIIGMWGLLIGFSLLIAALPFHKIVFFGGRGIMGAQSPEIPHDEHLHHKVYKEYEKERKAESPKTRQHQDVLSITGIAIILIAVFMV
ncbi:hypothetical protein DYI25_05640 [Mesobacillus boroniphilus]|uniref:DUF3899 domain-containing protein n=1 Tax=Mesobacillus boroniphilus TaxID=308892 RepID=A0A944GVT0_9BACI|nr:hypothetical protein [Mesobacillus boroniphilus]MBS8263917.1 hypothetical protein [Mesobacillus boroniphilus]